jgi:hypothetical protein
MGLERDTALRLGVCELFDGGEMAARQDGVRQLPQALDRLRVWGIGWQEEQVDVLRHAQARRAMPPRPI